MAGLILKLLDLALLVGPFVIELFQRKRDEDESAKAYVKRQNEERLKTWEAMEEGGEETTRLARARIALARELRLRRKIAAVKAGSVLPEGTELQKPE